jgi:hypothetical protein
MHKRTFTRAAGVSPPWLSEPHLQVQCDDFRNVSSRPECIQRGAYAPPLMIHGVSSPPAHGAREKNDTHKRTLTRAAGVARRGRAKCSDRRVLVCTRCLALRCEKTIFALHKRTFARAAGVSPPWAGKCVSADRSVVRRQIADGVYACAWMAVAIAFIGIHGGLTPPALGAVRPFAGEKTIFRCRNARSQVAV